MQTIIKANPALKPDEPEWQCSFCKGTGFQLIQFRCLVCKGTGVKPGHMKPGAAKAEPE